MVPSRPYQDPSTKATLQISLIKMQQVKTMGTSILLPIIFAIFAINSVASQEKVLFGQPSSISAEARQSPASDAAKDTVAKDGGSGRKARVFTFPGSSNQQQQDPRTHQPSYVISSPYEAGSPYETTEDRFAAAAASQDENNRLLSFLPTFGDNGMQVGLDFKLPFFQIPYAKMFSGGGLGGLFTNRYGSSLPAASATSSLGHSALGSSLLGSSSSSLATMAAMAATAAMLYPKVSNMFSLDGKGVFRDGGSTDDFLHNMNSVLGQFNIDGESCLKVALCSLGNAKQRQHTRGRNAQGTSTPADVVDNILNLPQVKKFMSKGSLTQARDFGGSGGDCDYFNDNSKCPVSAQTFQNMFSSLG
ncbi:hypothetical protein JTE90_026962 [Oedothorax gibbosus]|uniref:Uncharacterized protein n=1 Tax=Oedothorax gibbosus TaxID=931172 RepID=A0AAV6UXW0_9ARAC|nr:hypothetical protein JTE90_026962 [Oedothorax gibbosus]